jgi:hypothetical protein
MNPFLVLFPVEQWSDEGQRAIVARYGPCFMSASTCDATALQRMLNVAVGLGTGQWPQPAIAHLFGVQEADVQFSTTNRLAWWTRQAEGQLQDPSRYSEPYTREDARVAWNPDTWQLDIVVGGLIMTRPR